MCVSHFKGLISGKVELEAQESDSTFTFHDALLKKAILLHKMARVPFDLLIAVHAVSSHKKHSKIQTMYTIS